MLTISFHTEVFAEGDQFVAIASPLGVSSFGDTPEEAEASLQEAVAAFLGECEHMGTLDEVLEESGYHLEKGEFIPPKKVRSTEFSVTV